MKTYVFPVLWLLIAAAIAIALTKLAFFSGNPASGDDGATPTATVDEWATVTAERGDIASTLELAATVRADPGTPVTATHTGEITKVWAKNGDSLSKGARMLQVRVPKEDVAYEPAPAPVAGDATAAPAAPTAPKLEYTYHNLLAPRSGTVRDLRALAGQALSVGDPVATLAPGTYSLSADLTPEQQLQLLDTRIDATATLSSGGKGFACSSATIDEDDPEKADNTPAAPAVDPMTGMPMDSNTSLAQLTCAVPTGTKVVPGLTGTITVDLGSATDVITVPVTAVEGTLTDGAVYLPPADNPGAVDEGNDAGDGTDGAVAEETAGEPERIPVALGLRDTDRVEVKTGLEEGQEILQFVPGVDNPDDPMLGYGMG